jgi:hypothetical protein
MKKVLLAVFAMSALFLASCNKENVTAITTEDLSQAVQLSAARTAATSDSVTKKKCKSDLTPVLTADLPAAITTYISTNYAGAEVRFAGKDAAGQIVVGLKLADATHKGLLFGADGTFKEALQRYPKGAKLTEVDITTLPAAITAYISKSYAGATIKKAGKNEEGQYHVAVVLADGSIKMVVFNTDNSFKEEKTKPDHPEKRKGGR